MDWAMSRRAAVAIAAVAGVCGALVPAGAQNRAAMMRMMAMEDPSMMFDGDMSGMGGRPGAVDPDDPTTQITTDLGRAILNLDFSRDPASVLAARASLAAKARDALVKPPAAPTPPTTPAPLAPGAKDATPAKATSAPEPAPEPTTDPTAEPAPGAVAQPDAASTPGAGAAAPSDGAVPTPAVDGAADTPDAPTPEASTPSATDAPAADAAAAASATDESATGESATGESATGGTVDDVVAADSMDETDPMAGMDGVGEMSGAGGMTPEAMKQRREAMQRAAEKAERFRLLVVAGDWEGVGAWLRSEAGEDAGPIYAFMLMSLASGDSALVPDEVIDVSEACPVELTDKHIALLGQLLQGTKSRGADAGAVAAQIRAGTVHFGGATDAAKRKRAATLFVAAGLPVEAQAYLPPLEEARALKDADLLDIYAVYYATLARDAKGREKQSLLERGWSVALEVMTLEKASSEARTKAVSHALGFISAMDARSADEWLAGHFAGDDDIGWAIVRLAHEGAQMQFRGRAAVEERVKALELLQRVGRAIMTGGGATTYRRGLDMLTLALVEEAEMTKRGSGGDGRATRARAMYGMYPGMYDEGGRGEEFQAIPADQLAKLLPDAEWLAAIDPGLSAKLEAMVAETVVGSGDLDAALAMIRPVAAADPERAAKLGESLLAAWPTFMGSTPGATQPNRYMYYGYGQPQGIPLTRARQVRALDALSRAISGLRSMGLTPKPESMVAAFDASHSNAEVYRAQDIAMVFGPMESMATEARRALASSMRSRLAGVWRNPQVQDQAKTKRTNAELNAEVVRGYALARELAGEADPSPNWEQAALLADLTYDASEFLFGQDVDMATYLAMRGDAFARYARAADLYSAALASGAARPSAQIYLQWFNAALGASDVGALTRQKEPDDSQVDAVAAALRDLGEDAGAAHVALFSTAAREAMGQLAPELKARYARQALRVVGGSPAGRELSRRLEFYEDLTREVTLGLAVDGGTDVSHTEPFGVTLAIWSTRAVARESGGFSRYLENEQWNYMTGAQVDYRDDLEKRIRAALVESFEVESVTFHPSTVKPMGFGREGWEAFPLAYILMKPKAPEVDRIPPISMDLEFSDGDGTVLLPVTTALTLIDAKSSAPVARSVADLAIEQTLDDRDAADGQVRLTVVAKGKGLIPALDTLIDTSTLDGLVVASVEEGGQAITELDTSGASVVPVAERTWNLTLLPRDAGKPPASFTFPAARQEGAKVARKRFADADVVEIAADTATVPLASIPTRGTAWWVWALAAMVVGGGAAAAWRLTRKGAQQDAVAKPSITVPAIIEPVGAVALLRRIEASHSRGLADRERDDLVRTIADVEQRYFAPDAQAAGADFKDLRATVERWASRVQQAT
jgi:hypothetical protein